MLERGAQFFIVCIYPKEKGWVFENDSEFEATQ